MKHIVQGKTVLIDDEDEKIFQQYKWHINDSGYVVWRGIKDGRKQTIRLHRLIAKTPSSLVTDHINRNKLDNRKCNLRCVTQGVNTRNRDCVINAKGYYYSNSKCRVNNKWVVDYMGVDNTFATEEEARKAVEEIKNGTFVKAKYKNHDFCSKCGREKEIYGGVFTCKECRKKSCKKYYEKLKEKRNGKDEERGTRARPGERQIPKKHD